MPGRKTFVKPGKEQLIVPRGRRAPESAEEVMVGLKKGSRIGSSYVGKPDFVPEVDDLDAEGVARKRAIRSLLTSVIIPNSLSSKTSSEQDKRSLVGKLNKRTLKELNGFIPDRIKRMSVEKLQKVLDGTEEITDEEKVEMQDLYKSISP